jgi:predicted nucleic acid-binding protein
MKSFYFDTSVFLKLLVPEPESERIFHFVQKHHVAIPYTRLMELETENTLQAKFYRKEMSAKQLENCLHLIRIFLSEGKLFRPALSLDELFLDALDHLSKITASTGCRTLDLLHIVSAQKLGFQKIVTTDLRQAQAATFHGLEAIHPCQ